VWVNRFYTHGVFVVSQLLRISNQNFIHILYVVVSGVRRMDEVNACRARLVPGWVTRFSGGYTISVCNKPTRSTQSCIPPGSLNRVPASAGVRAGMSPLPGGREHCVIPCGMWVPVAVWQPCELLYTCYLLTRNTALASNDVREC